MCILQQALFYHFIRFFFWLHFTNSSLGSLDICEIFVTKIQGLRNHASLAYFAQKSSTCAANRVSCD